MKMICPVCGLKGTADDTLLGKKVRCPECQQIFYVDDSVTVLGSKGENGLSSTPVAGVSIAGTAIPEGVKVCKKCGFAFSEQFVFGEADPLCAVCLA